MPKFRHLHPRVNQTTGSSSDGQSASLRDRIAAAIINGCPDHITAGAARAAAGAVIEAADAVIKELGLRREQCPCSQRGPNCAHRYVTEWIVTE